MGVVSTDSLIHTMFLSALTLLQGYPEDLVVSIALGADMFDCVWPTRTAVSSSPLSLSLSLSFYLPFPPPTTLPTHILPAPALRQRHNRHRHP